MIQVTIDTKELDRLVEKISRSPQIMENAKRAAFEAAAPKLKAAVDAKIGGSGKVKGWQTAAVGSKGGYAAVRPKTNAFTEQNGRGKRYAVGAVTNAIESGHRFPPPGGKNETYRARIKSQAQKVPGKHFYEQAQEEAQAVAQAAAEQVVEALAAYLEE